MQIIFSKHARLRCRRQGIIPEVLKKELSNVPTFHGEIR